MPPVPIISPHVAIRVFESFGWRVQRQKGSHIILTKEGSLMTLSVPAHKELARGTLRSLIGKAGITVEEFTARL